MKHLYLLMEWCVFHAAKEVRTPAGMALVVRPKARQTVECDVGSVLFTVSEVLNTASLRTVRRSLMGGAKFSIQFFTFTNDGDPWVITAIWVPCQGSCFRGIFRVELLTELYSRVGKPISAALEEEVLEAALEELVVEEKLAVSNLQVVTCQLGPNNWSVYEQKGPKVALKCIVPASLDNEGLTDWAPKRMGPVLRVLEELSLLCISDSYLGRVLSAHGVQFTNLPSIQSILYWPFVERALAVIIREHRNLAQLVASGGTDGDDARASLADLLEDSSFLASCRLVLCVAKPLGEALSAIAATQDLVGYLTPVLDFVNWLRHELTFKGPESVRGVCWERIFTAPGKVRELVRLRGALPCLRALSLHRLDVSESDLFEEMQKALIELYDCWCRKFEGVLTSPVCQILLLPLYRIPQLLPGLTELDEWAEAMLGATDSMLAALDKLLPALGVVKPLGVTLKEGLVLPATELGTALNMALVSNW